MAPGYEIRKINAAIKELMKRKGRKYQDLAEFLGLSVSSVKRVMNSGQMSLDRLNDIAVFLEVSLFTLLDFAGGEFKREDSHLTLKQEEFLAERPETFAYLGRLMEGKTVQEIEETFHLSRSKSRRILRSLEKQGFIEVWPDDKVKFILPPGFIVFRRNGPVNRAYYSMRFNHVVSNMRRQAPPEPHANPVEVGHFLKLLSFSVSPETYNEIMVDFKRLIDEKANKGIREETLLSQDEMKEITIACYIDSFDMWEPVNNLLREG